MKRAIVAVINDLSTDQRVHKHGLLLRHVGYDVQLVGRLLPGSAALSNRPYRTHRFRLFVHRGPLFYALYNLRLFLHLMLNRCDLIFSNDLDTLLPCYLASRIKGVPLVYDSHELFTEVPELEGRWAKKVWTWLEGMILPSLKHAFTVNGSIAEEYKQRYGITMSVIRNVPQKMEWPEVLPGKMDLNLRRGRTHIVLQGAGINVHRGAEEAVQAMKLLEHATLLIIGSGDVIETLKQTVAREKLEDRVTILGRMPYEQMMLYTRLCDIGLTLDRDTNLNYRYSLPNKVFDYMQAGVAVLCSNLPEVCKVVAEHEVGMVINEVTPQAIAAAIETMRQDQGVLAQWKQNGRAAMEHINWEKETTELKALLQQLHG